MRIKIGYLLEQLPSAIGAFEYEAHFRRCLIPLLTPSLPNLGTWVWTIQRRRVGGYILEYVIQSGSNPAAAPLRNHLIARLEQTGQLLGVPYSARYVTVSRDGAGDAVLAGKRRAAERRARQDMSSGGG